MLLQTLDAFEKLEESRSTGDWITQLEGKLLNSYQKPEETDLTFLKSSKILDHLGKMDGFDAERCFLRACKEGDEDVIDAVMGAHSLFQIIPQDKRDQGLKMIQERKYPEDVARLKELRAIHYVVDRLFDAARRSI